MRQYCHDFRPALSFFFCRLVVNTPFANSWLCQNRDTRALSKNWLSAHKALVNSEVFSPAEVPVAQIGAWRRAFPEGTLKCCRDSDR